MISFSVNFLILFIKKLSLMNATLLYPVIDNNHLKCQKHLRRRIYILRGFRRVEYEHRRPNVHLPRARSCPLIGKDTLAHTCYQQPPFHLQEWLSLDNRSHHSVCSLLIESFT